MLSSESAAHSRRLAHSGHYPLDSVGRDRHAQADPLPPLPLRALRSAVSARRWIGSELIAYGAWTAFLTFSGVFFAETLGAFPAAAGWLLTVGPAAFVVASAGPARVRDRATGVPGRPPTATATSPEGLSEREGQVLELIADGLSNEQIADHLHVSPRTVEQRD